MTYIKLALCRRKWSSTSKKRNITLAFISSQLLKMNANKLRSRATKDSFQKTRRRSKGHHEKEKSGGYHGICTSIGSQEINAGEVDKGTMTRGTKMVALGKFKRPDSSAQNRSHTVKTRVSSMTTERTRECSQKQRNAPDVLCL